MAELKPYDPNKPKISINKEGWLERMAEAGIPLSRALKYFHENPDGKATKFISLAAEDLVPFYSNIINNGDATDYVTEAIMLGMPMPGPKTSKKVMTPKGERTYQVNQRIPELDVERNQNLDRLLKETNDINWRESDYNSWYGDDYVPEVGDTWGGSEDYPKYNDGRYESKSIDPDDFNNLMDELEAEGAIDAADDYKFDVNSQEYTDAKQTKADLDKIYSEMNDDTALLTNEKRINDDLENRARNEYWKKRDEIADKYINPDWKGTKNLYDDTKGITPEQFDVEKYRKYLTDEEINTLKKSLPEMEEKIRKVWPELADEKIAKANATIEKGYTELPKPWAVQAFPDYEAMTRYRAEMDALPKDLEYTEATPRPASDVFDFVANDPELLTGSRERNGLYPKLHDINYIYKPESAYTPAEDLVNASISRYTEPYRITMRDFDQMTNLINDLRDPTFYNRSWAANLKQEINGLKENELLTAQDKERMKETVDYYAEQLANEPDPDRRKALLSFFKNDLDAAGLMYDGIE